MKRKLKTDDQSLGRDSASALDLMSEGGFFKKTKNGSDRNNYDFKSEISTTNRTPSLAEYADDSKDMITWENARSLKPECWRDHAGNIVSNIPGAGASSVSMVINYNHKSPVQKRLDDQKVPFVDRFEQAICTMNDGSRLQSKVCMFGYFNISIIVSDNTGALSVRDEALY